MCIFKMAPRITREHLNSVDLQTVAQLKGKGKFSPDIQWDTALCMGQLGQIPYVTIAGLN